MATRLYTAPDGTKLAYYSHGTLAAFDRHTPIPGKDEWGMDTLQRTMYVPAPILDTWFGARRQGEVFTYLGVQYFLQTFQPSPTPPDTEFSMLYKGLSRGLPNPLPANDRVELVSTLSADDLSVSYQGKTITSASSQVRYDAPQTTWRYIANSMPTTPRNLGVKGSGLQVLSEETTLSFDDGTTQVLAGSAPAAVSTALFRTPVIFNIGPSAVPIIGTPYWEAVELAQLKYPGS